MSVFELSVHGMRWAGPPIGQLDISHADVDHYERLIGDALNAQDQAREIAAGKGWPDGCKVCGDSGHHAGTCHHNPLLLATLGGEALLGALWKCFHCGAVFTDEESAKNHFGKSPDEPAACTTEELKAKIEQILRDRFDCAVVLIPADIHEATNAIVKLLTPLTL